MRPGRTPRRSRTGRARARTLAGILPFLVLAAAAPALAGPDTSPPVLAGFSFSPATIDTSTGPAAVLVTFHATDDSSGVASVRATFSIRDGMSEPLGCESLAPDSGTPLDGTYSCTVQFPRFSEAGTWQVLVVELTDAAGNQGLLVTAALAGMGFPTDLEVLCQPDSTPPALAGFSFLPQAIDTTGGAATVQVTFHATDDRSGIAWVKVNFLGPGVPGATHGCTSQPETPGQEAPLDALLTCDVEFPQGSPEGPWSVYGVEMGDAAGNSAQYPASSLESLGFPAVLTVTSQPDTSPPDLTGFSFAPAFIDTGSGAALVQASFTVSDDLSGVAEVEAVFASPGAEPQLLSCAGSFPDSGTPLGGAYHCPIQFPPGGPEGTWTVLQVEIRDASGNVRHLVTADLAAAGFPVTLPSGFLPGPPRAIVELPGAGRSIGGDSVTLAARLLQGSPGEVSPAAGVRFEFRAAPFGSFAPVPAAEPARPNPSTAYPYFVHWNVSGLPDGDYELRAVAHDAYGAPDPEPAAIPVTILNGGAPEIEESVSGQGRQESRTAVDDLVEGAGAAGDRTSRGALLRFSLPAGSLLLPADTLRILFPDPAGEVPRLEQPEQSIGLFAEIALESGQGTLQGGHVGVLDIQYTDANQDGVVDGTSVREEDLELRRLDETTNTYVKLPPWTILTEHNRVRGLVTQTGRFALTRSLEPRLRWQSDRVTLEWDPLSGAVSYNVYRGGLELLRDADGDGLPDAGYGDCQNQRDPDLSNTLFSDGEVPAATGGGFFYLVSFTGPEGEKGLGNTSRGLRREAAGPCP